MDYWEGRMDWPLAEGWVCETCGERTELTWGLVNGICRCSQCHTEYSMRDWDKEERPPVTVPISRLKKEYKEVAKRLWSTLRKPVDEATDEEWEKAFTAIPVYLGGIAISES